VLKSEQEKEERKEELREILEDLVSDSRYISEELQHLPKSNSSLFSCDKLEPECYRIFYSENGFNCYYRDSEGQLYEISFFKKS